jgi:hypothetical protein
VLPLRRRETGAQLEQGGVLGVEVLVDVLVQLLVGAGRFGRVEIASAGYVAVGRVEVEGARDDLEVVDWYVLQQVSKDCSDIASARNRASVVRGGSTFILSRWEGICVCVKMHYPGGLNYGSSKYANWA